MTGATAAASSPVNAPELKIEIKKIKYSKPTEPLTIFWAKFNQGLYKTVVGPGKPKSYLVIYGDIDNVYYENYETVYFLKYTDNHQRGDIYKLEMPSKSVKRLANVGGIDYFFLKNNSIYYVTNSMALEPGVYRMSLEGSTPAIRVSPTILDTGDKQFKYYFGYGIITDEGEFIAPFVRKPRVATDETYIEPSNEEEYYEENEQKDEETLSTYYMFYSDYMGDADADSFIFNERDEKNGYSYLHLFYKGNETVRKIKDWIVDPLDILHGWAYFTLSTKNSNYGGLFAIRLDGSGLRQVGNGDVSTNTYMGSIKHYLVFKDPNTDVFTFVNE